MSPRAIEQPGELHIPPSTLAGFTFLRGRDRPKRRGVTQAPKHSILEEEERRRSPFVEREPWVSRRAITALSRSGVSGEKPIGEAQPRVTHYGAVGFAAACNVEGAKSQFDVSSTRRTTTSTWLMRMPFGGIGRPSTRIDPSGMSMSWPSCST